MLFILYTLQTSLRAIETGQSIQSLVNLSKLLMNRQMNVTNLEITDAAAEHLTPSIDYRIA